jgi:hypothetical protein
MVDPDDRTKEHLSVSACHALMHSSDKIEVLIKIKAMFVWKRNKVIYLHFEMNKFSAKLEAMLFIWAHQFSNLRL